MCQRRHYIILPQIKYSHQRLRLALIGYLFHYLSVTFSYGEGILRGIEPTDVLSLPSLLLICPNRLTFNSAPSASSSLSPAPSRSPSFRRQELPKKGGNAVASSGNREQYAAS